jgi:hypothetical protein
MFIPTGADAKLLGSRSWAWPGAPDSASAKAATYFAVRRVSLTSLDSVFGFRVPSPSVAGCYHIPFTPYMPLPPPEETENETSPDFVADEESIFVGAKAMAAVLLDYLQRH